MRNPDQHWQFYEPYMRCFQSGGLFCVVAGEELDRHIHQPIASLRDVKYGPQNWGNYLRAGFKVWARDIGISWVYNTVGECTVGMLSFSGASPSLQVWISGVPKVEVPTGRLQVYAHMYIHIYTHANTYAYAHIQALIHR